VDPEIDDYKGEPNAWRLTPLGERVARQLSLSINPQGDAT